MENNLIDKTDNLLQNARNIAIVVGRQPSLDMMAAGLGFYLSLAKMGKKAQILCASPTTVSFGNLVGIDKVRQSTQQGGGNGLIISLPYQQGSIEKISYDIVGDRINLTVVPGPQGLNFTTEDISYQSGSQESEDLVFAIGVLSEEELYRVLGGQKQSPIVNIDTSRENTGFGTVAFVDGQFSSSSEVVTHLLSTLNLPVDIDIAQNLLSGIVEETGNFQSSKTSAFAFELAAFLMKKGARRADIGMPLETPLPQPFAQRKARVTPVAQNFGPDASAQPFAPQQQSPLQDKYARQDQSRKQRKFDQKGQAPKDWFEPRIYKGSTPVS